MVLPSCLKAYVVSQVAKAGNTMRAIFVMSIHVGVLDSIYLPMRCAKNFVRRTMQK
jgi:hypothetical protein